MKIIRLLFICFPFVLFSQTKVDSLALAKKVDSINTKIFDAHILSRNYKYKEAIRQTIASIEEAKAINNDSLIAKAHTSLGVIYTNLGKFDLALKEQKAAIKYSLKPNGSIRVSAWAYNNLGYAYFENLKEMDSAIHYFKKNLAVIKKIKNFSDYGLSYYNLGEMYEKNNQLDLALKTLDSAVYFSKKTNDNYSLSFSYQELSEVYIKLKDTSNSIKHIDLALNIAEKDAYNDILYKLYNLKYKISRNRKENNIALKNLEKYLQISDTIYKSNLSKITQETAAKYELKQKEKLLTEALNETKKKEKTLKTSKIILLLFFILFFISALLAYSFYKNNKLKKENNKLLTSKNEKLKDLQVKTELNFLKTQIQPHFFFNTLNNLYGLIIEKSDKAKDVVIKLSELMQYAIYDSKKTTIPLWDEINNIQNYLELESLRHHSITINPINIEGNIEDVKIPPLLFITFIENSFKHGNTNDDDFFLDISIKKTNQDNFSFTLKNSFKSKTTPLKNSGIGLENIKRRLTLIYNDKYDLITCTENNIYCVELKLPVE